MGGAQITGQGVGTRPSCWRNLETADMKEVKAQNIAPPGLPAQRWKKTRMISFLFFRLRKNLRALVVVHATWYVKAFLALLRPFIRYQL